MPAVVRPLEPPRLLSDTVSVLNAFYRRRVPFELALADEVLTIAAEWRRPARGGEEDASIRFEIGDDAGVIECPAALIEALLLQLDPGAILEALPADRRALLLECLLEEAIGRLEARLGVDIALRSVVGPSAARSERTSFVLAARWRGDVHGCTVQLANDWALRLAHLLDERQAGPPPLRLDVPVSVSIWRAVASLNLEELQNLGPGDVVTLDAASSADRAALVVAAGRFLARAQLSAEGCVLLSRPFPIRGSNWEWIMNQAAQTDAEKPEDSGLDGLPVTVAFELGRKAMPLSEVSALAPGAVVHLAEQPGDAVSIIAQGKRIGQGEIVRIGDALGVRIVRIFDHA